MTIIIRSVDLSPINDYNSDILFSVWPGLLRIITAQKNNSNDNYYPQCGLITKSIRRIITDHKNNSDIIAQCGLTIIILSVG